MTAKKEYKCAKCGRDMETALVGLPNDEGARVFWHRDGTPDACQKADALKDLDEVIETLQENIPHEPWTVTYLKRVRKYIDPLASPGENE